jgi:hypothetical protein
LRFYHFCAEIFPVNFESVATVANASAKTVQSTELKQKTHTISMMALMVYKLFQGSTEASIKGEHLLKHLFQF